MYTKRYKISRTVYRQAQVQTKLDVSSIIRSTAGPSSQIDPTSVDTNSCPSENSSVFHRTNDDLQNGDANLCIGSLSKDPIDVSHNVDSTTNISTNFSFQENVSNSDFSRQLARWAVTHEIPQVALNDLLKVLRTNFDVSLPCDSRTLLHTPRVIKNQLRIVDPGHYYHFGLLNCITKLLSICKPTLLCNYSTIEVCINIDGLPISKSSGSQFYPILCSLVFNRNVVNIVGIYHGYEKPKDANIFLKDFVDEAVILTNDGFQFNNQMYTFKINCFICDAPAKSFVTYIKGHSGYNSCTKCYIHGSHVNNRVCFPEIKDLRLRTHDDFISKQDEDHHMGTSILQTIPKLNMVRDFPLDYMHLILLGVVKKLLLFWCVGKPPNKLSSRQINLISDNLISFQHCIPCEFVRKPRSLNEVKRWKATEFRQFLLYTGPVVLKNILSHDLYLNFLSLHVACTILSKADHINHFRPYAKSNLKYFVESFKILYGAEFMSHNIHNLLHITDDTQIFGILDQFSAFPFENFLHTIKRYIRSSHRPLEQIICRLREIDFCSNSIDLDSSKDDIVLLSEHQKGPTLSINKAEEKQFRKFIFKSFTLTCLKGNNYCSLLDNDIVCIRNFVQNDHGIFIIGHKFSNVADLYTKPCQSSALGVQVVSQPKNLDMWNVKHLKCKCIALPYKEDKFAVFPLLH
uniref:Transposase domain-containing protein n=1 Tax=Photinus pyralis TaxID=7054 RepID=A0A1Y1LR20_PHOPY